MQTGVQPFFHEAAGPVHIHSCQRRPALGAGRARGGDQGPSRWPEQWRAGAQAGGEQDPETYFCGVLRMMPLANIDPSLAIAFYCRTLGAPGWALAGA